MKRRANGILLHISSLPSRYGIGDFGHEAYTFVDLLKRMKQSYWQILPLHPTETFYDSSPYHSDSAFAVNPLFISIDLLVEEGLLHPSDIEPLPGFPQDRIDYSEVTSYKQRCFQTVFSRFKERKNYDYLRFCETNADWLDTYVLFHALKSEFDKKAWNTWPEEMIARAPDALARARDQLQETIEYNRFLQFKAASQWLSLKGYCNKNGVHIIGDIPIYVDYDSADVWSHQENFKLKDNKPTAVAGVPPDYFSKTGQLWGNPVYRWDVMKERRFDWWVRRVSHNLELYDIVRIDHFRGLVAYWEIPADAETAIGGEWVEAPAVDLLNTLLKVDPFLPIIAEDLGVITADVREIILYYGLPGMKVLQFGFNSTSAANPHVPHNVVENSILYTGTHDNNTVRGWIEDEASVETKNRLFDYLGREVSSDSLPWELIRAAMMSRANTTIFPLQDLLCLGSEARMNTPSTSEGNWRWRVSNRQLDMLDWERMAAMTETYGRNQ